MFVILCILSCYYNNFVLIFTIGYQLDGHALAFLVACHFMLNLYSVITVDSVYGEINMMMMHDDDIFDCIMNPSS